ncbi:MAG: hypothetical protein IPK07_09410 [Deltaproteobacteria bacterium]|nr:hypothetical protein [Deltaproteobacteria bacterium]
MWRFSGFPRAVTKLDSTSTYFAMLGGIRLSSMTFLAISSPWRSPMASK